MHPIVKQISEIAEGITPELTAIRRDFHKNAESGWFEVRTSSRIAAKLTDLGYEVLIGDDVCRRNSRMGLPSATELESNYRRALRDGADPRFAPAMADGMTGVIGILRNGEGPTVAMRFDIDALGVEESDEPDHFPVTHGFASVNHGVMHACGHDGHAAIGLGVAHTLMEIRDKLRGTVKLIFQPAEEGVRGAKAIVENGHLSDVDVFISAHIDPTSLAPSVDVIPGSYGSLATTKYDVEFHGFSAHAGAHPQNGKNVMLALSTAILNLYAIPRHSSGATRINVGTVHAGSGRNVIADYAKLEIEVRGETTELNHYMTEKARTILQNAAEMHDCTCEIKLMGAADSEESSPSLCRRIQALAREELHLTASDTLTIKNSGSDDISYMMNEVQSHGGEATYMRILTPCADIAHNRRFDFDEQIIPNAVKLFVVTAVDVLAPFSSNEK